VTSVSGFLHAGTREGEGFGSDDPDLLGFYQIVGLPPGHYTVEVEEIDPMFTEGSGVGPLSPPAPLPGPPEFYSGDAESDMDDPRSKVEIEVTAGSRIENINIILNVPGNSWGGNYGGRQSASNRKTTSKAALRSALGRNGAFANGSRHWWGGKIWPRREQGWVAIN
jgi:hypothetical protein